MANVLIKEFTYRTNMDMNGINISAYGDGVFIKEITYSNVTFTPDTALNSFKFSAENFGLLNDNNTIMYEKDKTLPINEPTASQENSFKPNENSINTGVNIESTVLISDNAKKRIQKKQEKDKKELEDSIPTITISEELAKSKLSELNIPKSQVSKEIDLSNTSLKDVINTSTTNLSTFDLSKINETNLNLDYLLALGFTVFAISFITKSIINKIKDIDKKTKQKKKNNTQKNTLNNTLNTSSQVTTPTSVITPTPNVTGNDSSNYNKIDQYGKKKGSDKKRISNSKYSVDKRNRTDVLNSTKTVSTKKRTISYKDNPNYGRYY